MALRILVGIMFSHFKPKFFNRKMVLYVQVGSKSYQYINSNTASKQKNNNQGKFRSTGKNGKTFISTVKEYTIVV